MSLLFRFTRPSETLDERTAGRGRWKKSLRRGSKKLLTTFRVGTLPAVTLTTALLPRNGGHVHGRDRPGWSCRRRTRRWELPLVLFRVHRAAGDAQPNVIAHTMRPNRRSHAIQLLCDVQCRHAAAAVTLTTAVPETPATVTVGPDRSVVPPESVATGIVLVLSRNQPARRGHPATSCPRLHRSPRLRHWSGCCWRRSRQASAGVDGGPWRCRKR